jgi:cation diffusion facilitator CzcD-associated flavoprotein CzcO
MTMCGLSESATKVAGNNNNNNSSHKNDAKTSSLSPTGDANKSAAPQVVPQGPRVAVIGCGPGGMFFLHALSIKRRQLEAANDVEGLAKLPIVTVFEKASVPGGVWRSPSETKASGASSSSSSSPSLQTGLTNMYEGLWANANKELHEMADYTYQDHYGEPVPAYLPRKEILNYLMKRVTRNDETIFQNVQFNTAVKWVEWDSEQNVFHITTVPSTYTKKQHVQDVYTKEQNESHPISDSNDDATTTTVSTVSGQTPTIGPNGSEEDNEDDDEEDEDEDSDDDDEEDDSSSSSEEEVEGEWTGDFDKCVWAAGTEMTRFIPKSTKNLLLNKQYKGRLLHSTEVKDFESIVAGKRLLFVGDAYSAEDLALQAIKLGAEHIYISSRNGEGVACDMSSWPRKKVTVLRRRMVHDVTADGNGIVLAPAAFTDFINYKYKPLLGEDDEPLIQVDDISAVVFCTGYETKFNVLDAPLRTAIEARGWGVPFPKLPENWKMKPNIMTESLGEVEPYHNLLTESSFTVIEGIYRHALMTNPNMMFIGQPNHSEWPLLEVDVSAWLCLSYVCGDVIIPSYEEMKRRNDQQLLDEMDIPEIRRWIDKNYFDAMKEHPSDSFSNDSETIELFREYCRITNEFHLKVIARDMDASGYPAGFGNGETLTPRAEEFCRMTFTSWLTRMLMDPLSPDAEWRTFRDHDPSDFVSVFTGTRATPLRGHWMDLDDSGYPVQRSKTIKKEDPEDINSSSGENESPEPIPSPSKAKNVTTSAYTVFAECSNLGLE